MQGHEAMTARKRNEIHAGRKAKLMQKIRNASLKKIYEHKIAALADRRLTPHLLRIMCQDVPVDEADLDSRWGRNAFIKKCLRYYQGRLKEIERSERRGFFGLISF